MHGSKAKYYHHTVGRNFRMDTINAAYLAVKLPYLEGGSEARRANATKYDQWLSEVDGITPLFIADGHVSIYNQYVIRARPRDALKQHLADHPIGSATYDPLSLHQQPCFTEMG